MPRLKVILAFTAAITAFQVANPQATVAAFNDSGWVITYQENFDTDFVGTHGQTFGTDGRLIFQLINEGSITVANGYAQLDAPDFWNAALIRSTHILPDEYKVRTKIGYINYDLSNYEQADYDDPRFNTHLGHYENGVYFLTVTDDTCIGNQCAEDWWHHHRKMVIDIDNHLDGNFQVVFHPLYMVYMAPEENVVGNLLRTWTGTAWDTSPWNWNVAYVYDYDTWYYAELEKKDNHIILRLYDESRNIIEETTPVSLDLVNAMDDSLEFLYVGEPHTDDYEGDVRIDEITLLTPDLATDIGDDPISTDLPRRFTVSQNYPNPFNPGTTVEFSIPTRVWVEITIYNILGRKIQIVLNEEKQAGSYSVTWDGSAVASGVYTYRITAGQFTESRKMLLLK
jgi:hypothetical protein